MKTPDPNDHIADHDLVPEETDFDQDAWDEYQQAKEDLDRDEN